MTLCALLQHKRGVVIDGNVGLSGHRQDLPDSSADAAKSGHDDSRWCRCFLAYLLFCSARSCRTKAVDEQQQDHAQLGQLADLDDVVDKRETEGSDEHPSDEESGDCSEACRTKQRHCNHGRCQQNNDVQ